MASLLNMLNNFLGSSGKPSLFNLNSTNETQDIDFKSLINDMLDEGEGGQQILTDLLPTANGGVELPQADAAGKVLPSLSSVSAGDTGVPLTLSQGDVTQVPGLSVTASSVAVSAQQADESATLAASTASGETGVEIPVAQPALTAAEAELSQLPGQGTPATTATIQAQLRNGQTAGLDSQTTPAVDNASAAALIAPTARPLQSAADLDAEATRPVKLDAATATSTEDGDADENAAPDPALIASTDPASLGSAPASASAESQSPVAAALVPLPTDGNQQRTVAADESTTTTPTNNRTAAPGRQVATQAAPQPGNQPAATPALQEPQQFALEQAQTGGADGDSDAAAETPRPAPLPAPPAIRQAPTPTAPVPTTDANLANVTAMLNQGQSMNSLNERLQFMLQNGQSSAEIQLDPPELGSLQVRVTTRHEQTSVIFVAPNAITRDALEQQLPRLRDTLEGAGLQLQDANVFAQTGDNSDTRPQSYEDLEGSEQLLTEASAAQDSAVSGPRISTQLVDAYI